MKISIIRDILVIVTSIISFLIVYIKIIYSLFMEIIKMNYKNGPGQQSLFGIIVRGTTYMFIFLYIVLFIYMFFLNGNQMESTLHGSFSYSLIFPIIMIIVIVKTCTNFFYLIFHFHHKIQNPQSNDLKNKYEISNFFNIIFTTIVATMGLYELYYRFRYDIFILLIDQQVEGSSIQMEKVNLFLSNVFFELFLLGIFVTCIKLQEIIKDIKSDVTYILFQENEEIKCKSYLEYKDYYLIIEENGIERYISKGKIKEIRKIQNKYHVSIIITGLIDIISFCIDKIKIVFNK